VSNQREWPKIGEQENVRAFEGGHARTWELGNAEPRTHEKACNEEGINA